MHLKHKKSASKNVNWCYKKTIKTNYSVKRVLLDMQISLKNFKLYNKFYWYILNAIT